MTLVTQTHGGERRTAQPASRVSITTDALLPEVADTAVDEAADFGFLFPPSGNPGDYLPDNVLAELDELGDRMVPNAPNPPPPQTADPTVTADSSLPPVLTYWGQFLDHELTARTDRETSISQIETALPIKTAVEIEAELKNARSPRFDLDSVYGGLAIGVNMPPEVGTVISGMRHPDHPEKMRVGTCETGGATTGPKPDGLDHHRDLPRFGQVEQKVRDAYLSLIQSRLSAAEFQNFQNGLDKRAIIGDMRNDENLIIAQFHLSFLRFHNKVVDYLNSHDTGWIADFHSAKALTKLHYQWLIVDGYLKRVCDPAVVDAVLANRAKHFFAFRAAYNDRNGGPTLGNVLPLEFSVAAFRFGHTMVRNSYDYNKNFGRPGGLLGDASFELLFDFTGGGSMNGHTRLPENWIIDWDRFVNADPDNSDNIAARVARAIDTQIAPPLGDMVKDGGDFPPGSDLHKLFRQLARRNLRRGLSLRLPTGQALHAHLKSIGAVNSFPIANIGDKLDNKPDLKNFLENSTARLHERTPLWFYCLAEGEGAGGQQLGEVGSWIVASTFIATLLDDPESALSLEFGPTHSPLRMPDDTPIDTIEKWMKFALVLE